MNQNVKLNSERAETDEMVAVNGVDEETDLKLEMLRREIQMNRDIKSQITMFNAGKVSEGGGIAQGGYQFSENQDYYRDNFQYRYPGKIKNDDLIENLHAIEERNETMTMLRLKADLIEHYDYEAVSSDIWKHLASWYGYDYQVPRFLSYDARNEKTHLELYPQGNGLVKYN